MGTFEQRNHPARIIIADDFDPWRTQVRQILQNVPEWQVVDEACDGVQAIQKATAHRPDIVLLDLAMPALNGIEAARKIKQNSPNTKIIFVTQSVDGDIKRAALETGAEGYVIKANAASDLIPVIAAALQNHYR